MSNVTKPPAWCSWCREQRPQTLVEANTFFRNILRCNGCTRRTLYCRMCSPQAVAKGTRSYDEELCARCDSSIVRWEQNVVSKFCSWCFHLSQHSRLLRTDDHIVYECGLCTRRTMHCNAADCDLGMRRVWSVFCDHDCAGCQVKQQRRILKKFAAVDWRALLSAQAKVVENYAASASGEGGSSEEELSTITRRESSQSRSSVAAGYSRAWFLLTTMNPHQRQFVALLLGITLSGVLHDNKAESQADCCSDPHLEASVILHQPTHGLIARAKQFAAAPPRSSAAGGAATPRPGTPAPGASAGLSFASLLEAMSSAIQGPPAVKVAAGAATVPEREDEFAAAVISSMSAAVDPELVAEADAAFTHVIDQQEQKRCTKTDEADADGADGGGAPFGSSSLGAPCLRLAILTRLLDAPPSFDQPDSFPLPTLPWDGQVSSPKRLEPQAAAAKQGSPAAIASSKAPVGVLPSTSFAKDGTIQIKLDFKDSDAAAASGGAKAVELNSPSLKAAAEGGGSGSSSAMSSSSIAGAASSSMSSDVLFTRMFQATQHGSSSGGGGFAGGRWTSPSHYRVCVAVSFMLAHRGLLLARNQWLVEWDQEPVIDLQAPEPAAQAEPAAPSPTSRSASLASSTGTTAAPKLPKQIPELLKPDVLADELGRSLLTLIAELKEEVLIGSSEADGSTASPTSPLADSSLRSRVAHKIELLVGQYENRVHAFRARRTVHGSEKVWNFKIQTAAAAAGDGGGAGDSSPMSCMPVSQPFSDCIEYLSDLLLTQTEKHVELEGGEVKWSSSSGAMPPAPLLGLHRQAATILLTLLLELVPDVVGLCFVRHRVFDRCLDLFFAHPFCNCLHMLVLEMAIKACPSTATSSVPGGFLRKPTSSFVHPVQYVLRDHLFNTCQLIPRLFKAFGANKAHVLDTNIRLPFMGHLRILAHYMNAARPESAVVQDEMALASDLWEEVCQDCVEMDALEAKTLGGKTARKNQVDVHLRFSSDPVAQGSGPQPTSPGQQAKLGRSRADSAAGPAGWMNMFKATQ